MRYKFPMIETIDDVLPAIEGRDEFVVAQRSWGTVIDYQIVTPDSFPCPSTEATGEDKTQAAMIRRECRGLKFDTNGNLIARPYHKFFNLGEKAETQDSVLSAEGRFHKSFVILPKLDGSMIHPILWNDQVFLCTRMGITGVSEQAQEFVKNSGWKSNKDSMWGNPDMDGPWYLDFCYDLAKSGMTPIFEWCSRKQRIVIDYPEDQLVLTAIRVNRTGEYLTRRKVQSLAVPYKIPMVELYDGSWDGIEKFSHTVKNIEEAEGFVIRWDDGHMVKMKGEWYTTIHRAKDSISHEKRIVGMILNGDLDDVLPHLLSDDHDRLVAYEKDFWKVVEQGCHTLATKVSICQNFTSATGMSEQEAKSWFARQDVAQYKGDLSLWKGLFFQTWDGKKPRDIILAYLRKRFSLDVDGAKSNGSQAVVDELRAAYLLPEKNWLDY